MKSAKSAAPHLYRQLLAKHKKNLLAATLLGLLLPASGVVVAAQVSLGDRVWYDLNMDGIQDLGEAGVPGVSVALHANVDCTGSALTTTTTSSIGFYQFANLDAGSYCLQFTAPQGWNLSPANAASADKDSNATTTATAYQYVISNITLNSDDSGQDVGIFHAACTPATLANGAQGVSNENVTWSHPTAFDFQFGDLNVAGFCAEKADADPVANDQYSANLTDRNGISALHLDYLSRLFAALGDPDVLAAIQAAFPPADHDNIEQVLKYVVWYYTDWNQDFTQLETAIDEQTWTAGQKAAMKILAQLMIDRSEGTNGETQYPVGSLKWLYNETDSGRQDIIAPAGLIFPESHCAPLLTDIQLSKTSTPATARRGDTVVYTLTVQNTSNVNASGVAVTDVLPASVNYVSDNGGSPSAYAVSTGIWTVGNLDANSSKSLEITVTIK